MSESGVQSLLRWSRAAPDRVAVSHGQGRATYAQMAAHVANAAKALEAAGVRQGMIVGVECAKPYLRVVLVLACEVLGATHAPFTGAVDPANATARRCQMFAVEHAGEALRAAAPVVAVDAAFERALGAVATEADLARLAASYGPDLGVRIASTSGTTGAPKHMLRTRRMVSAAIESYDDALLPLERDDVYLCHYSPAIGGIYTDVVRALRHGNRIAFVGGFDDIVAECQAHRCYGYILPKEAEALALHCRQRQVKLGMRYVDVTGAGVSEALAALLREWVTPHVGNVYSSNEASVIAAREAGNRYAIVPGVDVRIEDEAGRPQPPGAAGRIAVRSPMVVEGYLWDEALSAQHFRDGWYVTSDLGFVERPGRLVVLGRWDDMLNIGGLKIAPYPIEQGLKSVAGVGDVVLIEKRTAVGLGVMCAVVEPQAGADARAVADRVAAAMKAHATTFSVRVRQALPRTETGKVRRELLRAEVDAGA
jgi:acyl-coenzyme A synthetase/AMP-(fatty) acid ligase